MAKASSMESPEPAIDMLWPPAGSSSQSTFRALPNREDVRFLIPTGSRRIAVGALLALRDNSTPRARRRNRILAMAWGRGWMPGDEVVLPSGGVSAALSELVGSEVTCAVHLGPRRANRKPVIAVMSAEGEVMGFAKVGVDALTDRLVSNEAAALRQLKRVEGLLVPELVAERMWADHALVVQTPLDRSGQRYDNPDAVVRAQVQLAQSSTGSVVGYITSLTQRVDRISVTRVGPPVASAQRLASVAKVCADHPRVGEMEAGPWHGDWRSTNMQVTAHGVAVWDWERFDAVAPRGFDALHYALTQRAPNEPNISALVPWLFATCADVLAPFNVESALANTTASLYLVELAARYLEDDQQRSGARLGDVTQWLLPALEEQVRFPA